MKSLGFETLECRRLLASLPAIVDNTSPNFSTEGDWPTYQGLGYEGDFLYSTAPYDGNDTATWRFDLEPGNYRIAASWKGDSFDYGSQVPITLYDGDVIIVTAQLNQNFASNGFFDGGAWWEELGTYAVSGTLKIVMTEQTLKSSIADAFRVERIDPPPQAIIVDNAGPGFTKTGTWYSYSPAGYAGTINYAAAPYNGGDTATWSFNVTPGTYRVSATWHGGWYQYGSNVPVGVYDGWTLLGFSLLDQTISPSDRLDSGTWWEDLGVFAVGSSLTITMSDSTNGIPIADAMRVERVDNLPYASVVDNASSSFSTTGVWTNYGPNAGYAGTFRYATAPYNSNDTATWAFNISPGTYRIAATWPGNSNTWGSNIPLGIYDGQRYVGGAMLNQHLPPNDFISQSTPWENVGVFTILDSLRIVMSNKADGIPIADAFRVERVSAESVPVANDDRSYSTPSATDLVVTSSATNRLLANDSAVTGVLSGASLVTQPQHGTLLAFDGQGGFTYRPNTGFVGVDTFTYRALSSNLEQSIATAAIAVGTPLLPRKNLDANVLNTSMPDAWLQTSLLDPALPTSGFGMGYANVPLASSAVTDGALALTGGLLLMEDVAQDTWLNYRSDAITRPIATVDTQLAPGTALPSAITAQLTFNGVPGVLQHYATSDLVADSPLRIALQADGSALPSGLYDYTIDITLTLAGTPVTQSFSGKQAIVNRAQSEFGQGWGLEGLDRLYPQASGPLVVRGNGDAYWFPLEAGLYAHAAGDISHSRLVKNPNNSFTLTSKYGVVSNFSATGLLQGRVDTNGNTTSYAYADKDSDSLADELVSITDPMGKVVNFGYSGSRVASITHYSGKQTSLQHSSGNLTSSTLTDPDGAGPLTAPTTTFVYSSNKLERINAESQTTTYNFSPQHGRLSSVQYPDDPSGVDWELVPAQTKGLATTGATTPLPLATQQPIAEVTDQRDKLWTFRSDRFGGIVQSTTPLGNSRSYLRDQDGQLHTYIEPDPEWPDAPSSAPLPSALPAAAAITRLGYNSTGDVTFHQAADGGTTHLRYSFDLHRLTSIVDPVGSRQSFVYDSLGNTAFSFDAAGFATRTYVDARGMTTRITQPDPDGSGYLIAPDTHFSYDPQGKLAWNYNPDGSTQYYYYNTAGQLTSVIDELSKTTSFQYDTLGRLTSSTNRVNATTNWGYDRLSRPTSQTDPLGNVTITTYNGRGAVATIAYPDPDGSGPLLSPLNSFQYDASGNLLSERDPLGNFQGSIPYTYDDDNRLQTVGTSVSDHDSRLVETYHYDHVGRLTKIDRVDYFETAIPPQSSVPPTTSQVFMRYDQLGRMRERFTWFLDPDSPYDLFRESFEYDAAGRLVKTIDGEGNVSTNEYDSRGLLVRQSLPDPDGNGSKFPSVVTNAYDGLGRLTSTDRGYGRVTQFYYTVRSWLGAVQEPDPDGSGPAAAPMTYFAYDPRGDLVSRTDAMSRTVSWGYDDEQRLLYSIDTDPDGAGPLSGMITFLGYNANNWQTYVSQYTAGAISLYEYDHLGRITKQTEPDPDDAGPLTAPVTQFKYDASGLERIIDPLLHDTLFNRDERGRVKTITDTAGQTTDYQYDFYDNLRKVTAPDPDGSGALPRPVTDYVFDARDRLLRMIEPPVDVLAPSVRPLTVYTYDRNSNLSSVTDSSDSPSPNTTSYLYDNQNRLILETNPLDKSRSYAYDTAGNLTRSVDRNNRIIEYSYDKLDRQTVESWNSGYNMGVASATAQTVQDGHKISEQQVVAWSVPSSVNNLTGTFTLTHGTDTTAPIPWDASAVTVQAALAALPGIGLGNVSVSVTEDIYLISRTFKLTFRGAKSGQDVPQTTINTAGLNIAPSPSYLLTKTEQTTVAGATVPEKQRLSLSLPPSATMEGEWVLYYAGETSTPLGPFASPLQVEQALEQMSGIDNVTVTNFYGYFDVTFGGTQAASDMQQIMLDVSHLTAKSSEVHRFETSYNTVGEVTKISDSEPVFWNPTDIVYTRDNLGRATNITTDYANANWPTMSLDQKFDVAGNRSQSSLKVGGTPDFKNTYAYDKLHRLTEVTQSGQAGATWIKPKRVTQSFNALGQRTGIERFESLTSANPVASSVFSYDGANRLSGIAHKQGTTNLNTYAYAYDPLSRLSSVTSTAEGLTNVSYDQRSQLVGVDNALHPDESFGYDSSGNRTLLNGSTSYTVIADNRTTGGDGWTYTYDNEGNMLSASGNGQYWTYTWDYRNRLVKAQAGPTNSKTYQYDAFNRLISDGNKLWAYDEGINSVMEYAITGGPRQYYLWSDAVDDLLAAEQVAYSNQPGNILWPLSDHLGTIRDIADRSDSTGVTSVVNHRRYDSFGQLKDETNAAVDLIFGYTGKQFDEFTGLQNNLNRWYNPRLGKFVSQDPIGFAGGDANLYRYVGNRPPNAVDPSGLVEEFPELRPLTPVELDALGGEVGTAALKQHFPGNGDVQVGMDGKLYYKSKEGIIAPMDESLDDCISSRKQDIEGKWKPGAQGREFRAQQRGRSNRKGIVNLNSLLPPNVDVPRIAGVGLVALDMYAGVKDGLDFPRYYQRAGTDAFILWANPPTTLTIIGASSALSIQGMDLYEQSELGYQAYYIDMYFNGGTNGLAPRIIDSRARAFIHSQLDRARMGGKLTLDQEIKYSNSRNIDEIIPIWSDIRCKK